MKLKQLTAALEDVPPFADPNYELEQYKTGACVAAQVVFAIHSAFGDLHGKRVVDLGCGTGILGIGAALLGAAHVVGVDCDPAALQQARETVEEFGVPMDLLHAMIPDAGPFPWRPARADTVLMNPPFGTRRAGADMAFVRAGLHLAHEDGVVYSLHKSSTRAFFVRFAEGAGIGCQLVAQLRFDIPATYAFHTEDSLDVDVDLLRFVKGAGAAAVRAGHSSIPPYVAPAARVPGVHGGRGGSSRGAHGRGGGRGTAAAADGVSRRGRGRK